MSAYMDAMLRRREAHRRLYEEPPYTIACPVCGAEEHQPCTRRDGERRLAAHMERIEATLPDPSDEQELPLDEQLRLIL